MALLQNFITDLLLKLFPGLREKVLQPVPVPVKKR